MNLVWRQGLNMRELTDHDQLFIQDQLDMKLYGMRKETEPIAGFRILHQDEQRGRSDFLLLRRNFQDGGFSFDLTNPLGQVTDEESNTLHEQVERVIAELIERHLDDS